VAPSFAGPPHQPGAGITAGTDEMFFVLHLLSHGASWRTFDFLGFTHYCAKRRDGHFAVRRRTIKKRQAAKLKQVKTSLMARRHRPIEEQGRWLGSVVRGHLAYYSVPGNIHQVSAFRDEVIRLWRAALRRRSQKTRMNWQRMRRLADRYLPRARYTHPWPDERFAARTQVRSPVR